MLASWEYNHRVATITIRNLDENTKRKLQLRAALNGRSMEAEARELLRAVTDEVPTETQAEESLYDAIRKRFAKFGGVELEIPEREFSNRPIPTFER